jgi:carbon-monoxide dehydrogenase small subunit
MNRPVRFELNGYPVEAEVRPHWRLIDLLRGPLGLTGTKEGCGEGVCGACTVLVDGRAVNACVLAAPEVEGSSVITIEGLLGEGGELSALQKAFVERGAIQCGFCSPGMIMAARALLDARPRPSEEEIREALAGNLCRCTGYRQIVEAVQAVAAGEAGGEPGEGVP